MSLCLPHVFDFKCHALRIMENIDDFDAFMATPPQAWEEFIRVCLADPTASPMASLVAGLTQVELRHIHHRMHLVTCANEWDEVAAKFIEECLNFGAMTLGVEFLEPRHRARSSASSTSRHHARRGLFQEPDGLAASVAYVVAANLSPRLIVFDIRALAGRRALATSFSSYLPLTFRNTLLDSRVVKAGPDLGSTAAFTLHHLGVEVTPILDTTVIMNMVRHATVPEDHNFTCTGSSRTLCQTIFDFDPIPGCPALREALFQWRSPPTIVQTRYLRNCHMAVLKYLYRAVVTDSSGASSLADGFRMSWIRYCTLVPSSGGRDKHILVSDYKGFFVDPVVEEQPRAPRHTGRRATARPSSAPPASETWWSPGLHRHDDNSSPPSPRPTTSSRPSSALSANISPGAAMIEDEVAPPLVGASPAPGLSTWEVVPRTPRFARRPPPRLFPETDSDSERERELEAEGFEVIGSVSYAFSSPVTPMDTVNLDLITTITPPARFLVGIDENCLEEEDEPTIRQPAALLHHCGNEHCPSNSRAFDALRIPLAYCSQVPIAGTCRFCGGPFHQKYNDDRRVVCPRAVALEERDAPFSCAYVLCHNRRAHTTFVCPVLHSHCSRCGWRGHGPEDCNMRHSFPQLRRLFELYADMGKYTARRHFQVEWGLYPVFRESRFFGHTVANSDFDVSYAQLIVMAIGPAYILVERHNERVRSRVDASEEFAPRHGYKEMFKHIVDE